DKVEAMREACKNISVKPICIGRVHEGDGCVLNMKGKTFNLDYNKFESFLSKSPLPSDYLKSVLSELKLA
ncbi:MAG TPA: hypothetical protein VF941_22365, partial [Clostridia bacterium]